LVYTSQDLVAAIRNSGSDRKIDPPGEESA
jgi:hypothetical protein